MPVVSTSSFPFLHQSAKCIHSWVPVLSTKYQQLSFLMSECKMCSQLGSCGQYQHLSFLQSTKCIHSWVPVVSTNSFPFLLQSTKSITAGCLWSVPIAFLASVKLQNVSTAGCLWSVPTAFLSSVKVQNVSTAGCLWLVPTAFFSSEYKMYPQLDACGQYQQLSFLQSNYKMYHSWVPVVSTNSFPFFKVQIVFTAGCLWSVPVAFSIAGCLWSVPTAFLSSKYKMCPQLGACGQYQQLSFLQSEYKMYLWLGACV